MPNLAHKAVSAARHARLGQFARTAQAALAARQPRRYWLSASYPVSAALGYAAEHSRLQPYNPRAGLYRTALAKALVATLLAADNGGTDHPWASGLAAWPADVRTFCGSVAVAHTSPRLAGPLRLAAHRLAAPDTWRPSLA